MSHDQPDATAPAPLPPEAERLERYLDGLMEAGERAEFERAASGDPNIQAQIDAHRRLGAALGQLYHTGAAAVGPLPFTHPAHAGGTGAPRRLLRIAAVAAALALPVCAAVYFLVPRQQAASIDPKAWTSEAFQKRNKEAIVAEYKRQVASGFKPAEVCTTDAQFREWTQKAFGRALTPTRTTPGTSAPAEPVLAGWSRATMFSSYSGLLLAHVDGKPVMVVMDPAPPDRMVPPDDASGSPRVFRRKVNDVWLIEVTPLDGPRVISGIEPAAVPAPAP